MPISNTGRGMSKNSPSANSASRTTHHALRITQRGGLILSLAIVIMLLRIGLGGCTLSQVTNAGASPTPTDTALPTEPPGPTATPDAVQPNDIIYIRKFIY